MAEPTLIEPPPVDEPAAIDPADQPADANDSIKAMAEKFKQYWPGKQPTAEPAKPEPAPTPAAPAVPVTPPASATPTPSPATDAPTTAEPEDVPEPPANQPITRQHFKKLSQAAAEYKKLAAQRQALADEQAKRAKALEDELGKLKTALPPNLEEVQKSVAEAAKVLEQNKQLQAELETLALERSPKFKQWWESETSKHLNSAKNRVPVEHRDAIGKLLMEPPSTERDAAIDKIVSELPGISQRIISGALENIEALRLQREEALAQGSTRYKELQAHEAAEQQKKQEAKAAEVQKAVSIGLAHAKAFEAFKPTGDPAQDAEIPQREEFIKAAIGGRLDQDTYLKMPAMAADYLRIQEKVIPQLKAEIAKRDELIKQLQGASPQPSGGSAPKAPKSGDAQPQSFAEKVKSLMAGR